MVQGESSSVELGAASTTYAAPYADAAYLYGSAGNSGGLVIEQASTNPILFYNNSIKQMEIEGADGDINITNQLGVGATANNSYSVYGYITGASTRGVYGYSSSSFGSAPLSTSTTSR